MSGLAIGLSLGAAAMAFDAADNGKQVKANEYKPKIMCVIETDKRVAVSSPRLITKGYMARWTRDGYGNSGSMHTKDLKECD